MGNTANSVLRAIKPQGEESCYQRPTNTHSPMIMLPYSFYLPRPLSAEDKIIIEGKIAHDAEIFSLNLVCDDVPVHKPHNVAYHHKVNFGESTTVLNCKIDGQWQTEQQNEAFVDPGDQFEIMIHFNEDGIIFYYNGNHHSNFEHQIPIEHVKYLHFWHGIERIDSFKVEFSSGGST